MIKKSEDNLHNDNNNVEYNYHSAEIKAAVCNKKICCKMLQQRELLFLK